MKVLITGGAGFIGSHLADRLLARGDEVLVLDNFSTGRRDNLSEHGNLEIIEGDIEYFYNLDLRMRSFGPDVVIHAAASYKDPKDWKSDVLTNIQGTVNVVQSCQRNRIKRLIYFQTSLCYGLCPKEYPITLQSPSLGGGSSYAISKTAGEQYIELSSLNFVSFRLANIYGPRNMSGPIPLFFERLSEGKPCHVVNTKRDFIYIGDLIDLVMKAIDGAGQGYYHVSSGKDHLIKEIHDCIAGVLGISAEAEVRGPGAGDVPTLLLDPAKTILDFAWEPLIPLAEGIRAAVNYYEKFGVEETYTHLV